MKKTLEELRGSVDARVDARAKSIVDKEKSIESKTTYVNQLKTSLVDAQAAYETKVKNINTMIEKVETGVVKSKQEIADHEENLERLLVVQTEFDAKYAELEAARVEEVEIKDDMSKGLEDFKYIEKKLERIKKELAQVAAKAGSVYLGR